MTATGGGLIFRNANSLESGHVSLPEIRPPDCLQREGIISRGLHS